jgi:hypothetical protein
MKKALLLGFVVTALVSCGDGGPQAGSITLQLATPNQDDGAVQFRITATAPNIINSVSALCAGCRLFDERVSDTEILGIVTGNVSAGDFLSVSVSDVKTPSLYSGSVRSVAARDYSLRLANGYTLSVPVGN